ASQKRLAIQRGTENPSPARSLASGPSQREERDVLGDGDCRGLWTSKVNNRYEARSCCKDQGSHKRKLSLENSQYLPLMLGFSNPFRLVHFAKAPCCQRSRLLRRFQAISLPAFCLLVEALHYNVQISKHHLWRKAASGGVPQGLPRPKRLARKRPQPCEGWGQRA